MRSVALCMMLRLLLPPVAVPDHAVPAVPREKPGEAVGGICASIRLEKTRFVYGEPIVVDLQITNVMPVGTGEGFHAYVPWVLSRPSTLYQIRAVNERGEARAICGGVGKDTEMEVLHLPPGHFCGYRLTCGSRGYGGHPDLPPGKYRIYAVYKSSHDRLPGPGVNVDIDTLEPEERSGLGQMLLRESRRIDRENERLGEHRLWTGAVFSSSITVEIAEPQT